MLPLFFLSFIHYFSLSLSPPFQSFYSYSYSSSVSFFSASTLCVYSACLLSFFLPYLSSLSLHILLHSICWRPWNRCLRLIRPPPLLLRVSRICLCENDASLYDSLARHSAPLALWSFLLIWTVTHADTHTLTYTHTYIQTYIIQPHLYSPLEPRESQEPEIEGASKLGREVFFL